MLLIAGDHVPVILFVELLGNELIVVPEQNGPTCVKTGLVLGVIIILIVCVVAQSPAVGVKVYKLVAVLLSAGDQVPVILFVELEEKTGIVAPLQ